MADMMSEVMADVQENITKKLDEYIVGNETNFNDDETFNETPNDFSGSFTNPVSQKAQNDVVDNYLMELERSSTFWDNVS